MLSKDDILLRQALWQRVTSVMRSFFAERGFLEVTTPLMVRCPGMEPNLSPFGVDVRDVRSAELLRAGLITSPEYSMKKLLGAGLEAIYTITPVFRNDERAGIRWGHEFTMVEWYRQGENYVVCMEETQRLVERVLGEKPGELWPRLSYCALYAERYGIHPADETLSPQVVEDRFEADIMPELLERYPRFVLCEYPVEQAALAQRTADGRAAQRFEAYVNGLEICNGFTELVDAVEQRRRFLLEAEERRLAGKEVFPIDEELLSALSSVRSPSYGNALGVDRLVMIAAQAKDIDSIHLFPPSQRFYGISE
jgi:lysyl-tRNA synthetase class 2